MIRHDSSGARLPYRFHGYIFHGTQQAAYWPTKENSVNFFNCYMFSVVHCEIGMKGHHMGPGGCLFLVLFWTLPLFWARWFSIFLVSHLAPGSTFILSRLQALHFFLPENTPQPAPEPSKEVSDPNLTYFSMRPEIKDVRKEHLLQAL